MDANLARKIALLGKKIPREWKREGVKEDYKVRELREASERLLHRKDIPLEVQKNIYESLESGSLSRKHMIVDEKNAAKIDRAMGEIIEHARRRGEIPSQKEAQQSYRRFIESRKRK